MKKKDEKDEYTCLTCTTKFKDEESQIKESKIIF